MRLELGLDVRDGGRDGCTGPPALLGCSPRVVIALHVAAVAQIREQPQSPITARHLPYHSLWLDVPVRERRDDEGSTGQAEDAGLHAFFDSRNGPLLRGLTAGRRRSHPDGHHREPPGCNLRLGPPAVARQALIAWRSRLDVTSIRRGLAWGATGIESVSTPVV